MLYEKHLQLATSPSNNLHQRSSIAQAHLTTLNLSQEPNFLPTILEGSRPPDLGDELVGRLHGRGEPALELLNIAGIAASQGLQEAVSGKIPAR
jgi:hypothetical protein